jgi:hypothetical protein
MQRTIGYKPQAGAYNVPGIPAEKHRGRSQTDKVQRAGAGKPADGFLTTVFKPLHIGLFHPEFSEANYKYIYDSLMNYSRLLKREFRVEYDPFDLKGLCDKFRDILPGNNEFRLIIDDDEQRLTAWLFDDRYDDHSLYFLPCGLIDRTEGLFREILTSFFQLLRHKQHLRLVTQTGFYEMMDESISMEDGLDPECDWVVTFREYESGYKRALLDIIAAKPGYSVSQLRETVQGFSPRCNRESNLTQLILEGLEFLSGRKRILGYGVPPDGCSDDYTVSADEVIQISYGPDPFEEEYIRYLNESVQDSGFDFISGGRIMLSPETKKLLKPAKFVVDFMNWLNNLNDELYYL